jgi:cytosine/adenosine deaminase-related metal-dependent hydrolase
MAPSIHTRNVRSLKGVRLANRKQGSFWDITFTQAGATSIAAVTPSQLQHNDSAPLVLPALVHPHIHLDKAFVHCAPEYSELLPVTGSFQEALSFTGQAKARFTATDLLRRGAWLIAESVAAGVTAMRAFVEVDSTVEMTCLEAGKRLKDEWRDICRIQLVCFAQDAIFSGEHGENNRRLMEDAIRDVGTDVIGTTPYVETSIEASKANIEWAVDRAWELGKHLDFHLDYNLDENKEALVWHVLHTLKKKGWKTSTTKAKIMLGHCTRLTLFSGEEWSKLSDEIRRNDLPVSFVALPTSDMYMAAPPQDENAEKPHVKLRGTLQVLDMIRNHGIDAVMGVNNVGNAFTPWGSSDPLFLACLGVGIYQGGTLANTEMLYECVSTRARAALGLVDSVADLGLTDGRAEDLLILSNDDQTGFVEPRRRRSLAEVVWDPPTVLHRDIVINGRLLVKNRQTRQTLDNVVD